MISLSVYSDLKRSNKQPHYYCIYKMEKAAMSLELICDDQLQTDIGKAIKENRKAIYAEALKQMQNHKIGKILTMQKPTRLGVHKASCEAIEAALTLFQSKLRANNELADIINPRLREAENKKYMESEEYKQEQAYRKIVEDHQKRVLQRNKEKHPDENLGIQGQKVNDRQETKKESESQLVTTVKGPIQVTVDKVQEVKQKKEENTQAGLPQTSQSSIFTVAKDNQPNIFKQAPPSFSEKSGQTQKQAEKQLQNIFSINKSSETSLFSINTNTNNVFTSSLLSKPAIISQQKPNESKSPLGVFSTLKQTEVKPSGPSNIFGQTKPTETEITKQLFGQRLGDKSQAGGNSIFGTKIEPASGQNNLFLNTNNNKPNIFSNKNEASNFQKKAIGGQKVNFPSKGGLFGVGINAAQPTSKNIFGQDSVSVTSSFKYQGASPPKEK